MILTLTDDVDEICDGVCDGVCVIIFDEICNFFAVSISFARCNMFGRLTNQLQTCNWLVISLNCSGESSSSSSSSIDRNKAKFIKHKNPLVTK